MMNALCFGHSLGLLFASCETIEGTWTDTSGLVTTANEDDVPLEGSTTCSLPQDSEGQLYQQINVTARFVRHTERVKEGTRKRGGSLMKECEREFGKKK